MTTGTESLLKTILDCGSEDLSILEDVQYDWADLLKRMCDETCNLNSLMWMVFQVGYEGIQVAIDDRICELEAIVNERPLDDYEEEELARLRELDATEDFESYHNYLDTHVWCQKHADTYEEYMMEALETFRDNTGFYIALN